VYLSNGNTEDPAWVTESEEISDQRALGLTKALSALDERSRDIVQSRWLANEKAGLKDLAEVYGVSMERIRQIEAKAFEKMQPYLEAS
jgi:RNA polymerase sigma-32 factor